VSHIYNSLAEKFDLTRERVDFFVQLVSTSSSTTAWIPLKIVKSSNQPSQRLFTYTVITLFLFITECISGQGSAIGHVRPSVSRLALHMLGS